MPDAPGEVIACIGIGSNVDPERNIPAALDLLAREVELLDVSTFYRTPPLGHPEQPEFLNGACRVAATMAPRALKFDVLRGIERKLGRVRTEDKYAPRTVDLDVLLYGGAVVDEEDLQIPDPEIRTRPFVAVPLLEVAPDAVLPDTGERLADVPAARQGESLRADISFSERIRERYRNERETR